MEINEILNERTKTHGDFKNVAAVAQRLKLEMDSQLFPIKLTSCQREALDMIASKIARIICGNPNEVDYWRDIVGYAQLVVNNLEQLNG